MCVAFQGTRTKYVYLRRHNKGSKIYRGISMEFPSWKYSSDNNNNSSIVFKILRDFNRVAALYKQLRVCKYTCGVSVTRS